MPKIAILGGGINGFGCAIKIKEEYPKYDVTIFTKDLTPNTTGDGSAGLWEPYLVGDTPAHKINQWSTETFKLYHQLWLKGEAGSCLLPCLSFSSKEDEHKLPSWKDIPYGYRALSDEELRRYNQIMGKSYKSGSHTVLYTCEPKILLPYLKEKFTKLGGSIVMQEVTSLSSFIENDFDVVINCLGLAARDVVPDDKVYPTRGQVARVSAPWLNQIIFLDSNYIIPNINSTVLGGTGQKDDYNTNISQEDSKMILNNCREIVPGLKSSDVLYEWAGLRPSRHGTTRLERSDMKTTDNKNVIVIHNYGHGGSGFTLFWGCASEVLRILKQALKERTQSKL